MIGKNGHILAAAALLALGAQPAAAQGTGMLASKIELEKSTSAASGQPAKTTYVAADVVVPGDRVRVTLNFTNSAAAPASGVVVINPIPKGLVYDATADKSDFSVSVDGGNSFGELEMLTVPAENASLRPATAADVTHVRWQWPDAIAPGQSRSVAFFGRVR